MKVNKLKKEILNTLHNWRKHIMCVYNYHDSYGWDIELNKWRFEALEQMLKEKLYNIAAEDSDPYTIRHLREENEELKKDNEDHIKKYNWFSRHSREIVKENKQLKAEAEHWLPLARGGAVSRAKAQNMMCEKNDEIERFKRILAEKDSLITHLKGELYVANDKYKRAAKHRDNLIVQNTNMRIKVEQAEHTIARWLGVNR